MFLNCSLSQLSPHPGSWYREMCGCIKFKSEMLSWGRISTVFLWKAIALVIFQEGEGSSL